MFSVLCGWARINFN